MQADYLFNGIKGNTKLKRFSYIFNMCTQEANKRYKILQFYEKYGLEVTKDAFEISRRTIHRWKAKVNYPTAKDASRLSNEVKCIFF